MLTAMMALDTTENDADDSGDEDDFPDRSFVTSPTPSRFAGAPASLAPKNAALGRLRFSVLLQTILQDSQTRLVFRAQAVIQSEVLHYVSTPEDLRYPGKLEEHKGKGLALWTEDETLRESEVGGFRLPREEVQVTWYPTLKRTVWVLSKLNTYVNVSSFSSSEPTQPLTHFNAHPQNAIFEDFAGEAVTLCRKSLSNASTQLSTVPSNTKIDGHLFLIRHLLLLKEMIRSVDLVQIERAADFSSVTGSLDTFSARGIVVDVSQTPSSTSCETPRSFSTRTPCSNSRQKACPASQKP